MKVLYDHQIFERQRYGGISRYIYELYRGAGGFFTPEISVIDTDNEYIVADGTIKVDPFMSRYKNFLGKVPFRGKKKLYYFSHGKNINRNKLNSLERLKGDCDIFHPSYYDTYFLDRIEDKPFVITVHDMIHEIFPEFVGLDNCTPMNKEMLCHKAKRIIAISESTKRDLVKCYQIDEEKIDVIYHGSSIDVDTFAMDKYESLDLPEQYLLFVGNRTEYKNFYFFIYSIRELLWKNQRLKVLCTGSPFSANEILYFRKLNIESSIHHLYVKNDAQFSLLYRKAECFVFPSLYEGFGIPILEAFACNCPVVLSDSSCFPEVAQKAALYFDPKDSQSIREAIEKTIYNKKIRDELKQKGLKRLKDFSWEKTIEQTHHTYMKALNWSY